MMRTPWAQPNQLLPDQLARAIEFISRRMRAKSKVLAAELGKEGVPISASNVRGLKIKIRGSKVAAKKPKATTRKKVVPSERKPRQPREVRPPKDGIVIPPPRIEPKVEREKKKRLVVFRTDAQQREKEARERRQETNPLDRLGPVAKVALLNAMTTYGTHYSDSEVARVLQVQQGLVTYARQKTKTIEEADDSERRRLRSERPWKQYIEALRAGR